MGKVIAMNSYLGDTQYTQAASTNGIPAEVIPLLKQLTASLDDPQSPQYAQSFGQRAASINSAAKDLGAAIATTTRNPDTVKYFQDLVNQYSGNKNNFGVGPNGINNAQSLDIARKAAFGEPGTNVNNSQPTPADTSQFSFMDFLSKKFNPITIILILVVIVLLWIGFNGLAAPAIKTVKGAMQ